MSLVKRQGGSGSSYFVVEGDTLYLIFNGSILEQWTSAAPQGFLDAESGDRLLQENGSKIYAD